MTDAKKGVQNPPADQNPEVKAAKAKVNPQAVGAVLAKETAAPVVDPMSEQADSTAKTGVETSSTDNYMKNYAPLQANEHTDTLRNADVDEEAQSSVPQPVENEPTPKSDLAPVLDTSDDEDEKPKRKAPVKKDSDTDK